METESERDAFEAWATIMEYGDPHGAARQQHIKAATEYELADAALARAEFSGFEVRAAHIRCVEAAEGLREATLTYLLSLSQGLHFTEYTSLDELTQDYLLQSCRAKNTERDEDDIVVVK